LPQGGSIFGFYKCLDFFKANRKEAMNKLLILLHFFVGIGALYGGGVAVLNPVNPMGISVDVLQNSPFSSFLIPGIILFLVVGVGNIFAAAVLIKRFKYSLYISHFMGLALVGWIVVQCIMMRTINILHTIYFAIGAVETVLSLNLILKQKKNH
jgi:vacuolar-type H+-ATPase subunit I/STV1